LHISVILKTFYLIAKRKLETFSQKNGGQKKSNFPEKAAYPTDEFLKNPKIFQQKPGRYLM